MPSEPLALANAPADARAAAAAPRANGIEASASSRESWRILLALETSGGGSGRHVLDLAAGLSARGHDVHVLYSPRRAEAGFLAELAGLDRVSRHAVAMRRAPHPSDLGAILAIRRYLRRRGPFDVLHGHSSKGGALVRLAALGLGAATVYTPHCLRTFDPSLGRLGRIVYGRVERLLGTLTDAIIAVSPAELEHARAQGLPAARLHLVVNGVRPLAPLPAEEVRHRAGVRPGETCIGFVGRLVPQKAPERLVAVLERLRSHELPLRLAVVGDGPMRAEVEALARARGVADRLAWLPGNLGAAALSGFDVFFLPSRYEAMPYVLLEACSAGLPIVTTDVGGARVVVESGENGFVVADGDDDGAAEALARLARDPALRRRMAAASRAKASCFTLERMVDSTLAIYRAALGARQRGAAAAATP